MKKLAFTLAEVLIALSIISIIAAIAAPAIMNAKPDANKMIYLKIYDSLTKTVREVADNSRIYTPIVNHNGVLRNASNVPLLDQTAASDQRFHSCSGDEKLSCVLKITMGGEGEDNIRFTTPDGNRWTRQSYSSSINGVGSGSRHEVFTVRVNGLEDNGEYDPAHPGKKPNLFRFFITPYGEVYPCDQVGQMYVATRTQNNGRKKYQDLIADGGYKFFCWGANIPGNPSIDKIKSEDWPQVK